MPNYIIVNGELYHSDQLYHHGVKGMKWGVRKKRSPYATRLARGKAGPGSYHGSTKKKLAGYKRDLGILDNGGHLSIGFTKKRQDMFDKRDREILNKKISELESKVSKKQAAKERKQAIKQTTKEVNKNANVGNKLIRKRAAKYIVDNNMSMDDAVKKATGDARRNTAIFLGAYGAVKVASLAANIYSNPKAQVLDSRGKVLRNFY